MASTGLSTGQRNPVTGPPKPTRQQILSQPRSGARPLGNSPGAGQRSSPGAAPRPATLPRSSSGTAGGQSSRPSSPRTPSTRQTKPPGIAGPARRGARKVRTQYRANVTTNYEKVIVAEFIVVVLLVAVAPFTRKNRDGLSPYYGQDLVQLVAIMAAYFILGLVAQGGQGSARVAAWFGGLLAVGIGLGEAAYLAKVFDLFGAVQAKKQQSGPVEEPQNAGASPAQGGA